MKVRPNDYTLPFFELENAFGKGKVRYVETKEISFEKYTESYHVFEVDLSEYGLMFDNELLFYFWKNDTHKWLYYDHLYDNFDDIKQIFLFDGSKTGQLEKNTVIAKGDLYPRVKNVVFTK